MDTLDQNTGNQSPQGAGNAGSGTGITGTSLTGAFNEAKTGAAGSGNAPTSTTAQPSKGSAPEQTAAEPAAVQPELKAWGAQLSKELKENKDAVKALAKFEDISSLASSYIELEKKLGSMHTLPGEKATKEELDAFYKKLGKPDAADKYGFKQEWDAEKRFAEAAYEANLSDAQAKSLYAFFHKIGEDQQAQLAEAVKKQAEETDAALKKEFGNKVSEKMEQYTKGLKAFASDSIFSQLEQTGLAYHPDFVKMFIKIGEALGESRTVLGDGKAPTGGITSARDGGTFSFFGT
jgi:hypothetical protein|nr:MAG TPA: putative protease [Caudoviricetes sp.]